MPTKYATIRLELHRRLTAGEYPIGHRLPTEQQLAAEFDVNRHTIRKAVESLASDGVIRRRPRHGTVVIRTPGVPSPAGGPVQVAYVFVAPKGEAGARVRATADDLARRFHARHPGLEVIPTPTDDAGIYISPLRPVLARSALPTVFRLTYAGDYASQGLLAPFDGFEDFADVAGQVDPRLIARTPDESGVKRVHAMPVQAGVWMMVANRTLLRTLGLDLPAETMDWGAFEALCAEIAQRGRSAGVNALSLEFAAGIQFMTRFFPYLLSANGGRLPVDPVSGQVQMTCPGNARFLGLLRRLYVCGAAGTDNAGEAFLNKRSVFRLSVIHGFSDTAREHMPGCEIVSLPIPVAEAGSEPCTILRGHFVGALVSTMRTARDLQAAWEFVKFLVSAEAQEVLLGELHELPVRPDLADKVEVSGGEDARFWRYGMRHGVPTFDVPRNVEIHGLIQQCMDRTMRGHLSPESALAQAQDAIAARLQAAPTTAHVRDFSMVS